MKKLLFLSLLTFNCLAATTGTLALKGTVLTDCGIAVNANASAQTLNVLGGETAKLVATVTETCNNPNGFTITMSSSNGGKLTRGTATVPYTLKYDNSATYVSLLTTPVTVKTVLNLSAIHNYTSNVLLSMVAAPTMLAGAYTDTVTITILSP